MGRNINNGRAWAEQSLHTKLTRRGDQYASAARKAARAPLAKALDKAGVRHFFDDTTAVCPAQSAGMSVVLTPATPGVCRLRFLFGPGEYATGVMDGSSPHGLEHPIDVAALIAWRWQNGNRV